ncbi:MAG: hypothetical protein AB9882_12955 [Ignavibacteriaceae bacterium]
MKKQFIILSLISLFWGCNYPSLITDKFELHQAMGRELTILTNDSLKYNLKSYRMNDTSISGEGYLLDQNDITIFSGDIPFDSIQYIQVTKYNFARSIVFTGIIITAGILLSDEFHKEMNVRPNIIYTGPSGSGGFSCPYILSKNGEEYNIDGEAFSIALGKALEMKTNTMLYNLGEETTKEVKIYNERPETHYFNSVEINSVITPQNTIPVFDVNNRIFPLRDVVSPLSAVDKGHRDIIEEIKSRDGEFWESDLSGSTPEKQYEDVIEMEFKKERGEGEASFLINAQNTFIADVVFKKLGVFLEGDMLDFYHSIETDPEMIDIMKNYQRSTFLRVSIWDGEKWELIGELYPEGNMAAFSRVVRFDIPRNDEERIKIRLSSMCDVWKIDQTGIDFSEVEALSPSEVKGIQITKNNESIKESVSKSDDKYQFLMPGEEINITFQGEEDIEGYSRYYYAGVEGYLYEWISYPEEVKFKNVSQGKEKITLLKNILSNRNLFLPIVYGEWKSKRNK